MSEDNNIKEGSVVLLKSDSQEARKMTVVSITPSHDTGKMEAVVNWRDKDGVLQSGLVFTVALRLAE